MFINEHLYSIFLSNCSEKYFVWWRVAPLPVDVDRMVPACPTLLERVKSDFL